jgi:hypothetical protein
MSVRDYIQVSRSREHCLHFDEPSYLDMYNLYSNLQDNIGLCSFTSGREATNLKNMLLHALAQGKELIKATVIANTAGKNVLQAQGISIYFPEKRIHYSYKKTPFGENNSWFKLLIHYLSL